MTTQRQTIHPSPYPIGVYNRRQFLKATAFPLATAAIGSSFLTSCSQTESGPSTDLHLSYGVLRSPDGALPVVAADHGWFKTANLDVDFHSFAEGGGPKVVEAMAGGTPDIAMVALSTVLLAVGQQTADLQIVSVTTDPFPALPLISTGDIRSVPQLKAKRVSVPNGGGQYYELARILAKFDMSFSDIDYKPLSVGNAQAAFLAGKLDAVISSVNGSILIQDKVPTSHVLFREDQFTTPPGKTAPFTNPGVLVVRRKTARSKPKAVRAFIDVYHNRGIKYVTNPHTHDKAVKQIQDYMKSVGAGADDLKATNAVVRAYKWYDLKHARAIMNSGSFAKAIKAQGDFWAQRHTIHKAPDPGHLLNTTIINGTND